MKAALWLRVSTDEQTIENQRIALEELCARLGHQVVATFGGTASAYRGDHRPELVRAIASAMRRSYDVLVIWSLDRLDRGGIRSVLNILEELERHKVTVVSLQEPWLEASGPARELMIAALAWAAEFESKRKSERNKAAIVRRRSHGLPVGRQPGAKDLKPRSKLGYLMREERLRTARELEGRANGARTRAEGK